MQNNQTNADSVRYLPPYERRGAVFVLSGPSGVGKDAVLQELRKLRPDLRKALTATTREPREGEVAGKDYLFWTVEQFQAHVNAGDMLEWAEVYGNLYGTPIASVEEARQGGNDVLLKVDVQGAASARALGRSARLIFLAPPSLEELANRLRGRATDSDEDVARRLKTALHEMTRLPEFDYVVVNDDLRLAAEQVAAIITAEQCLVSGIARLAE
ncbi:MAG: guanylate kinase [Armatimonadetes bacterium]|nr:guanylate kinase [Armatimonadota bacterium]